MDASKIPRTREINQRGGLLSIGRLRGILANLSRCAILPQSWLHGQSCGVAENVVANTAEETEAKLAEIGGLQLRCYTDGGADGNGQRGYSGAAGWGTSIRQADENGAQTVRGELWGPDTDPESVWYCGVEKGTNNTGELIGIGQALMWLKEIATNATLSAPEIVDAPAVMLFDSCYAANMATGRWEPNANVALVAWVRQQLADVLA
eukprot:SAG31_NODE_495_length_14864_cov_21.943109_7_plen_207_part_00